MRKNPKARNGMRKAFKESVAEDEKLHGVVTKAMKKLTAHAKETKKEKEDDKD